MNFPVAVGVFPEALSVCLKLLLRLRKYIQWCPFVSMSTFYLIGKYNTYYSTTCLTLVTLQIINKNI